MYDVTKEISFCRATTYWREIASRFSGSYVTIILIGTKNDTEPQFKEVTTDKVKEFSIEFSIPFFEVSAKTGEGITEAFAYLLKEEARKNYQSSDNLKLNIVNVTQKSVEITKVKKKEMCNSYIAYASVVVICVILYLLQKANYIKLL